MHQTHTCEFYLLRSSAFKACGTNAQSCFELPSAAAVVIHTSRSPREEGSELRYNRGSSQALLSVEEHSYRPGVMTAQNFNSAADGNAFLRKPNLKFIIQLSFRISPPPEISCFLIFVTLQKNIKDAAIS